MRVYNYQTPQKPGRPEKKRLWQARPKIRWKKFFTWLFRLTAFGVLAAALLFLYYTRGLPDPNKLLDRQVPESTKILARDGSLLYEVHGEYKRTRVPLEQISQDLKNATIAVEDKDFYKHGGISFTGIARSAMVDIITGKKAQGASTITQQFVKNAILTKEKSWDRKIREAILSVAIESRFTKDEILHFYLNEIPYGRNAYGIEAAAQSYFGKSAKDLSLAQSAYLAALPQAPTYYNPFGPNREALDNRYRIVLRLMAEQGYIKEEDRQQALEERVEFLPLGNNIKSPHFVLFVEDYLADKYGETTLEEGGLKVVTTLDPRLQEIAEKAVSERLKQISQRYNAHNAALAAVDPKTGQILAMVGGKNYFGKPEPEGCKPGKNCWFEPNVNVSLSQRQPGSSFKPYVYATAFKKEFAYSPASLLMDVVTNFGNFGGKDYVPQNYNGTSYGPVSMRQALAGSLNISAVKTLDLVGVNNAVQTAKDLGITSPLENCGLSLVLGGCEVRLLDHVAAYAAIANQGNRNPVTPILKIEDRNGKTLEEYQENSRQVLDPQAAYQLISIMSDNGARSFVFGPNSPLTLPDRPVAAKTGTTQNWRDGWTVGFVPGLAAGVWAGNNDGTLMKKGADGVLVAAPIWQDFMKQALAETSPEAFAMPEGIQRVVVDKVSGKLPTDQTIETKTEIFASYSVPKQYDDLHIRLAIDTATGNPADSLTPPGQIGYESYTVFRSERPGNPNWDNPVAAWAAANGYPTPPAGGNPTAGQQPPPQTGDLKISIMEPSEGALVAEMPLKISIAASGSEQVSRMDLYLNGQFVQSDNAYPWLFNFERQVPDGPQIFAVKAVSTNGVGADTSVQVNFTVNNPLSIVDPEDGAQLSFPATIAADSAALYGKVSFYYQDGSGSSFLIGQATNTSRVGLQYRYSLIWAGNLPPGSYRVYAQSDNGRISAKIKITITP